MHFYTYLYARQISLFNFFFLHLRHKKQKASNYAEKFSNSRVSG